MSRPSSEGCILCAEYEETVQQFVRRNLGDARLKSAGEIEAEHMGVGDVAMMTLVRPFILMLVEPIVAFWNVYIALVYGILYIFIESYEVVFVEEHGFNLGENGLAFMVCRLLYHEVRRSDKMWGYRACSSARSSRMHCSCRTSSTGFDPSSRRERNSCLKIACRQR